MTVATKIFTALVLGILSFGIAIGLVGALPPYKTPTAQVITRPRIAVKDKPIVIVEREVIVEVIVEKIVIEKDIIPPNYREFEDLATLEKWALSHAIGLQMMKKAWWDCDDFAERFQQAAIRDGYWVSLAPVYLGDVWNKRVMVRNWSAPYHMGNMAMIRNDIYYIEPQTGQVVWVMNRDTLPEIQARDAEDSTVMVRKGKPPHPPKPPKPPKGGGE